MAVTVWHKIASRCAKWCREGFFIPVLLLLVVAAVYLPVVDFELLNYDDSVNIQNNPLVKEFSFANLYRFWSRPYEGLYVPLTYTVWGLLGQLAAGDPGLNPLPFHLANLVVHLAATLVLFSLLWRLCADALAAAAGALLFAVHPVQVEAVAWATGMKDLLGGFFSFLVLWFYQRHHAGLAPARSNRYIYCSLIALAAALLAKPSAVTVPLMAGLMAVSLLRRPIGQVVRELAPWLLLVVPIAMLAMQGQPGSTLGFIPSWGQRFLVAGDALTFYLGKLLLPRNLGIDYGRTPEYVLGHYWVYLTGLLPFLTGGGLIWLAWLRGRGWLAAVLGMTVIPLLPVLGFVPFIFQAMSTVADRYLYTAMLGPALAVAWLFGRYRALTVRLGGGGVLLLLAGVSFMQLGCWRNSETLAVHAIKINPASIPANHNLGLWYAEQGHYDLAIASYRKVLELRPEYALVHYSLGDLYLKLQRRQDALAAFRKAVEIKPDFGVALYRLGLLYAELGRPGEALDSLQKADEAGQPEAAAQLAGLLSQMTTEIAALRGAVATEPGATGAWWKLGELLQLSGRQDEALEVYRRLAAARPEEPETRRLLGRFFCGQRLYEEAKAVYLQAGGEDDPAVADNEVGLDCLELGRLAEAAMFFRQAVALCPDFAEAHANLGVVLRQQGRTDEAITAFRQAITLAPGLVAAYLDLGHLLASLGRDGEAVSLYRRAGEVEPGSAVPAYALGRHWLERGRLAEARDELEKALRIDPAFVPALASLAQLHRRTGRDDRALDYDRRAMAAQYGGGGLEAGP